MVKVFVPILALLLLTVGNLDAQEKKAPSPSATLIQKVGLTDVTIEYSRPGVKGRTVFAEDGLAPFGKLWRTGANAATKITFSDAVTIGDGELAAGSYAILTKPGADSWDINFYPYEASRWSTYSDADPMVTLRATPNALPYVVESFLITVDHLRDEGASILLIWEKTAVSFPIGVK